MPGAVQLMLGFSASKPWLVIGFPQAQYFKPGAAIRLQILVVPHSGSIFTTKYDLCYDNADATSQPHLVS